MFTKRGNWILGGCMLAAVLTLPIGIKAASNYDEYIEESWTTDGDYTGVTYYHRSELEEDVLFNGIDVSWWQGNGRGSAVSKLNWEKVHNAGIDFAFVRVGSRDTADGSIYEDTCADAHIQGAMANDINVGLYIFSQALNEAEAVEEAEYVLARMDEHDWDVTMPIVLDREAGSYKRLTAGKLSKSKETKICNAFADTISDAGYTPMVYASASWVINYMNTDSIAEHGCGIWLARYNNSTDMPTGNLTYSKLSGIDYEIWQYSSKAKVDGYSGNLDVDFWYKDTNVPTKNLQMTDMSTDEISLKWGKAGDAMKYRLYRYDGEQDKYVAVKSTAKRSCTDTDLEPGETYLYKVRGYWVIGGKNYYGKYSSILTTITLPEQVTEIEAQGQTADAISLAWDEVHGAEGYRLYLYDEDQEKYVKYADVGEETTECEIAGLESAEEYRFKVKAYRSLDGKNYWGDASEAYAAVTKPEKTNGVELETISAAELGLTWDEVERASGYQVYRLNPDTGKYEKVATIKDGETIDYTDAGLAGAMEYTYKVRAYLKYGGKNYYGAYSGVQAGTTKPDKTGNLKAKVASGKIKLTWDEAERVSGYQIYRLNSKTGKYEKIATVKGNDTFSYKDAAGLKKGTTYTYKVRAYLKYDGKNYYGAYSAATKVKMK